MKTFQPELPTHSHPNPNVHDGRTPACHHPSPPRHSAHATPQMCDTLGQSETFGDTTAPDTHLSPFETSDATPETYEECVESMTFVDEQDRNPNDDPHLKQSRVVKATGPRQPHPVPIPLQARILRVESETSEDVSDRNLIGMPRHKRPS